MRRFTSELRQEVVANLSRFERRSSPLGHLVRAAVAVTILPNETEACFALTRRADRPGRHAGQWALPGGRVEEGESAEEAALRELGEEVGVGASPNDVLGLLDDYESRSGFLITPVVVWVDFRTAFRPDPAEVSAAYRVPLAELEGAAVPMLSTIPESPRQVIGVPLLHVETVVHAPTAAILFQLREVALAGRATRVHDYEQPVFAWR